MKYPESVINELTLKADIVSIIGDYVSLSERGGRWWGKCPFHNEKTPSFTVNPEKELFYCFGCNKGGSVYKFLMEINGNTFVEAVKIVADKSGFILPESGVEESRKEKERKTLAEFYDRICTTFVHLFQNDSRAESARKYVHKRGITDETAKKFRLGYAPAEKRWLYEFLLSKNYSVDFLGKSGLFSRKRPDFPLFINRLLFPITDYTGQVIGFSGRALSDNGPKYINSPETLLYKKKQSLFGIYNAIQAIRKEKSFYLCEGQFDVLALHQAGVESAVAPLGTAFTPEQGSILKRLANEGTLLFDGDDAGKKAALKSGGIFEEIGMIPKGIILRQGMDPAEVLKEQGIAELRTIIEKKLPFFDFIAHIIKGEGLDETPEGVLEALRIVKPFINSVTSPVRRELYLKRLAETLKVSMDAVTKEMAQTHRVESYKKDEEKENHWNLQHEKISFDAELDFLVALTLNCDLFPRWKKEAGEASYSNIRAKMLFESLISCEKDDCLNSDKIIDDIGREDPSLATRILEKAQEGGCYINREEVLREKAQGYHLRFLQRRSRELVERIKRIRSASEAEIFQLELLSEKKSVDNEIRSLIAERGNIHGL